jgi:ribosomal protein S6
MAETKAHEDKAKGTIAYELGYHLVPSLGEDDLALRVTDLQKAIADLGGSILSEGEPQTYSLSYTMHKMRGGKWDRYDTSFFGWIRFELQAGKLAELTDMLEHNEHLIRHLLIKLNPIALMPEPERKPYVPQGEVVTEPKQLEKKQDKEEKGEVSEEELDKQIEQLIH